MAETDHFDVVRSVGERFYSMVVGDIGKAMEGRALVGAFILTLCAVDYLAAFRAGGDSTRAAYCDFVSEYFPPKYDATKLYQSLRCGLVHSYTTQNSYYHMTDGHPERHLKPVGNTMILNLEDFVADFLYAADRYFKDALSNADIAAKLCKRVREVGFLSIVTRE